MRVAMVSTPFVPVPPSRYGGTELIVAELCSGLRAMGHEVLLFATGNSRPPVHALFAQPLWPPEPHLELEHTAWVTARLRELGPVDVIHAHTPTLLPLRRFLDAPIVYTIHHAREEGLASFYARQSGVRYVAISERQLQLLPELRGRAQVIHHGLDPARYPLGPGGDSAVFLARLSAEKAPHVAIEVARHAGVVLRLAGRPHPPDLEYFRRRVLPLLRSGSVAAIGEVDPPRKIPLLRHACALLFPIDWEEPFGLVMIEAMLCGTPVLAFSRGSVPEVIDEGITGWICDSPAEMSRRLRELAAGGFDRRRCRERALDRFARDHMVGAYAALYRDAMSPAIAAAMDARGV